MFCSKVFLINHSQSERLRLLFSQTFFVLVTFSCLKCLLGQLFMDLPYIGLTAHEKSKSLGPLYQMLIGLIINGASLHKAHSPRQIQKPTRMKCLLCQLSQMLIVPIISNAYWANCLRIFPSLGSRFIPNLKAHP